MTKYNTTFHLDLDDIEGIESALRFKLNHDGQANAKQINELLGKIHNQKQWYRPRTDYVSG